LPLQADGCRRARNSPFSGRPDKWAPTTATATSLSASDIGCRSQRFLDI
jgi:hypothetical protein